MMFQEYQSMRFHMVVNFTLCVQIGCYEFAEFCLSGEIEAGSG